MSTTLLVPDRPEGAPSGGDRYDAALAARWRERGEELDVVAVAGSWPWPTEDQRARLARVVDRLGAGPLLLDGLVGCSAPEVVERSAQARPTAVLLHSLLAEGAGAVGAAAEELDGRERRALLAAGAVVATSRWAAARLAERHGLEHVEVAPPGTARAPLAPGSLRTTGAPVLLALGAVTPLKNHRLLLAAAQGLLDLPWRLVVAGPVPDPGHLAALREDAGRRGVAARTTWAGPVLGDDLEALWARTDLLVHPSRSETFGMVVTEAHARGIPAVVGAGTGAVEALEGPDRAAARRGRAGGPDGGAEHPGTTVATDDPRPLEEALRRWLTDPVLRERWHAAAVARRERLPGWDLAVRRIARALGRITP